MNLKSKFLSSVVVFRDADNEGKTSAQLEREKVVINKQTTPPASDDEGEKKEEKEADKVEEKEEKEEEKEEEVEEEEDEEEDGETEEKEEEKEVSAEDLKKEVAKLTKQIARMQKRVGRTQGERDAFKKELADAKASLEAKLKEGEQPLTEEEVNRRAEILAKQRQTQTEFEASQDRLASAALKLNKDFMRDVNELAADVAPLPAFIVATLDDLEQGNGGAVLNHLTQNPEEYEEMIDLLVKGHPVRVTNRLNKIADKLADDAKPKPKKISKVPPPPDSVKGNSKNPDQLPINPTENMEEYIRIRNLQDKKKREGQYR